MNIQPIQVMDEGVLIPHHYLHHAREFEIEFIDGYVLLRPKLPQNHMAKNWLSDLAEIAENRNLATPEQADESLDELRKRYPWIGMAESGDPEASARVEEILMAEIDRRSGWTHKLKIQSKS